MKSVNLPVAAFLIAAVSVIAYGVYVTPSQSQEAAIQVQPAIQIQPSMQLAQYAPPQLPPAEQLYAQRPPRDRESCNGENCPYAEKAKKLDKELSDEIEYGKRREAQWEAFYRAVNKDASRHGRPTYLRRSDNPSSNTAGAVNNGLYGEGRPQPGTYGEARPNAYGKIRVTCPNCNR